MKSKSIIVLASLFVAICVLGVVALIFLALNRPMQSSAPERLSKQEIDQESGQAVFLANGQVYFGKLEIYEDTYKLKNVYYIDEAKRPIKLGDELHKPKDEMFILKSQILFWENLRSDALEGKLK